MSDSPAAVFESHLAPILSRAYSVAFRLTSNRDDAEDLVQDAAVRAFVAFHSFQPGTNFKAWFLRILVNGFLNRRRKAGREPQTVPLDDAEDLFLYQQAARNGLLKRGDDPASLVLQKFDAQSVAAALAALPEEFRVVAALYLVEGLAYEEIAAHVGCPVGTVRSRLHRGRKLLQKALWELGGERGLAAAPA